VRQVRYLQDLYQDVRSVKHNIKKKVYIPALLRYRAELRVPLTEAGRWPSKSVKG
jgi:hypothetical protein